MGNSGAAEATKPSSSLRPLPCTFTSFDPLFKALLQISFLGDRLPMNKPCARMQLRADEQSRAGSAGERCLSQQHLNHRRFFFPSTDEGTTRSGGARHVGCGWSSAGLGNARGDPGLKNTGPQELEGTSSAWGAAGSLRQGPVQTALK